MYIKSSGYYTGQSYIGKKLPTNIAYGECLGRRTSLGGQKSYF